MKNLSSQILSDWILHFVQFYPFDILYLKARLKGYFNSVILKKIVSWNDLIRGLILYVNKDCVNNILIFKI